ncbi:transglutaminase [Clostridium carboxidivorans P7]|uniref:Transglutaminase domain protein n=1 Tax=Clostridium carboxidivorans P7 TaxID=536227 RepID=C6Q112_9CLOT|nr:cell wall-binding repeat-containing protein [Clostridium carboxidivorans]AKN33760.1 transglutaminase [Clostridium carboxidivorans P7]EET84831.1 transglutaminase domain protein [Clostridium carboxidivorans P7]EFG86636.1 transglutaminase-like family protein [Clostridium carboxidivorans P7]
MKKTLMVLMITAAISMSSTVAFAADTSTKVTLDSRANFSVTLQSNSLVFNNEPTDRVYDSISLDICNTTGTVVRSITYNRGQGNGATMKIAGIPDGSYAVRIGYVNKYFGIYPDKYAYTLEVKSGVGTFKGNTWYANNLLRTANERTDAYALSSYIGHSQAADVTQANLITAGITDDYAKVKAIHDWVANNMYYDYSDRTTVFADKVAASAKLYPGGPLKRGNCEVYAGVTTELMRAAGFPSKTVSGNIRGNDNGHAWNETYVDGRWVFVDTTFDSNNVVVDGKFSKQMKCRQTYFDIPMAVWSLTHEIGGNVVNTQDAAAWNGNIKFIDSHHYGKVLKEVPCTAVNALLTETYGFKAEDLYSDRALAKHWDFAKDTLDDTKGYVYVKVSETGAAPVDTPTPTPVTTPIKASNAVRLAGADRYKTAVAISQSGWTQSDNVILVDGNNYPDALVGGSYAYLKNAPVLITQSDKLNSDISAEIARLGAKNIYILGNTTSVSQNIQNELSKKYNVSRICGTDVFDTAVKVGEELRNTKIFDTVAISSQNGFADALAIAPFSARNTMPLLFSGKDSLRPDTLQALKDWNIKNVVIVGGTGVVSSKVEDNIKSMGINVTRLAGQDRYATALEIIKHFAPSEGYKSISICSGENFPDALTGAMLAAKNNTPLVLVSKDSVNDAMAQYINKNILEKSYIFGGTGAVSDKIIGK